MGGDKPLQDRGEEVVIFSFYKALVLSLFSFLFGAGTSVGCITATSLVITYLQPSQIVFISLLVKTIVVLGFRYIHTDFFKRFSMPTFYGIILVALALFYAGIIILSYNELMPDKALAFIWFFCTAMIIETITISLIDIVAAYFNPFVANKQLIRNLWASECGAFVMLFAFYLKFSSMPPLYIMGLVAIISFSAGLLLWLGFLSQKEICFSSKLIARETDEKPLTSTKKMLLFFCLSSMSMGGMEALAYYIPRLHIKETLLSYDAIQHTLMAAGALSSFMVIIIAILMGYIQKKFFPSPISIMVTYCVIVGILAIAFLKFSSIPLSVAIIALSYAMEGNLGRLPMTMFRIAFPHKLRLELLFKGNLCRDCLGTATIFLSIFVMSFYMDNKAILCIITSTLILLALSSIILILRYKKWLIDALFDNINSHNKEIVVKSMERLLSIKPKRYVEISLEMLDHHVKKLLRKAIILGLGHSTDSRVIEQFRKEFLAKNEEIQLAILQAVSSHKKLKNVQFIVEVMLGKHLTSSVYIRMKAAKILAQCYGKQALPILLYGLHESDERLQANILEVLGLFHEKQFIEIIEPFLQSPIPRIKANTLYAMAAFPSKKQLYKEGIKHMLSDSNLNMKISALYTIAKLKDKAYLNTTIELLNNDQFLSHPGAKRMLAFALSRFGSIKGLELFYQLFSTPYKQGTEEDFIHLFGQLSIAERFNFLEYMLIKHKDEHWLLYNVYLHLKHTKFDFHEELAYLYSSSGNRSPTHHYTYDI